MKNPKAYQSYFGGKSGNGTYQAIINRIPPHRGWYSLFLGNCGVTRNILPASYGCLNDLDSDVIDAWEASGIYYPYQFKSRDAVSILVELNSVFDDGDKRGAFIYLDPPYRMSSRKSQASVYKHEMTDRQHLDMLSQINSMPQFKIMVSHYPDPVYDEALKNWHTHDFLSMTRNGMAWERLYMNYEIVDGQLHDYRYLGDDFREREHNNRIKNNFIRKLNRLSPELRNAIMAELSAK